MISILKGRTPRDRQLQRKLLVIVIALIILTSLVIVIPLGLAAARARYSVSVLLTQQVAEQAAAYFNDYVSPMYANLWLVRKWGQYNLFSITNVPDLNKLVIPVAEEIPHVPSLVIANTLGQEYHLLSISNRWETRLLNPPAWGTSNLYQHWRGGISTTSYWKYTRYDPRSRPWFTNAIASISLSEVKWTKLYPFTDGQTGRTVSLAWQPEEPGLPRHVAAIDVYASDVTPLVTNLALGNYCCVFITSGTTSNEQLRSLTPISEPGISALMTNAVISLHAQTVHPHGIYQFTSGGQKWWAAARSIYRLEGKPWIYVAIPARELKDEIIRKQYGLLGSVLAVFIIGGVCAAGLMRMYHRSVVELSEARKLIRNSEESLRMLIAHGESKELEFKSTLRMNLATGKPGREIEYAWLKTLTAFMNTDGGTLLVGVEDDGNILGIEPDAFLNEDKYLLHFNNLINQHIGLEFARYIRFELRAIDNKKVLIIECSKVTEPVFLKMHKQEDFLIRVGPSSRKLTTSQAIEYLKKRK